MITAFDTNLIPQLGQEDIHNPSDVGLYMPTEAETIEHVGALMNRYKK